MDTKIIRTGTIKVYFERGFGFIYEDTADKKLCSWFFHIRACSFEPEAGMRVQFKIAPGPKGLMAIDIELIPEPLTISDALANASKSEVAR